MATGLGGTMANCTGGVTSWETWLTCEKISADDASSGTDKKSEIFIFAKNNYEADARVLLRAGKSPAHAGDKRDSEFCGACFEASGKYLFVNAQEPGITYAITGPWQRGPL